MSSVLRFDEWEDSNGVPVASGVGGFSAPGTILQVVQTVKTDTFSESVAQGAVSGDAISGSITPSSSSSKVLVIVQISASFTAPSGHAYLYRDNAVSAYRGDASGSRVRAVTSITGGTTVDTLSAFSGSIVYLDSPATTSSIDYSLRLGHAASSTVSVFLNRSSGDNDLNRTIRGASSITMIEVAG